MSNYHYKRGIVRNLVIIIAIVALLGYFSIDLRGIVEHPGVQANLAYSIGLISFVWEEYLIDPISYFWKELVLANISKF